MKQYGLWLDESGSFENDKEQVSRNRKPSLIGGVLFDKTRIC